MTTNSPQDDDLVMRLRDGDIDTRVDACDEAAARIESDAKRIRELERQRANWVKSCTECADELAALRELMNCYNLGGWTDAESLQKERDESRERERDAYERAAKMCEEQIGLDDQSYAVAKGCAAAIRTLAAPDRAASPTGGEG